MTQPPISCSAYDDLYQFFIDGHFIRGWDCVMTGGEPATQLFVFGVIFGGIELALFALSGSVVIPAILAILFGGVMFTLVPATLVNLALIAVLLLLGALGLLVAFRAGT